MLDNELIADDLDDIYSGEYPFEGYDDRLTPAIVIGLLVVALIIGFAVYRLGCW